MDDIKAVETLSGFISAECTLVGNIPCGSGLTGNVPCGGGLTGKMSVIQEYDAYTGDYKVTPQAFNEQILPTAHKVLAEDVVITKVPYWETSNISNGMTAYIAKEV